ncbi:hypothetical protein ACFWXA_06880 [Streptomyces atroolivaceus]|uniref:hypothetical protein n=1 Tax=Streptomyces atroolivaceus TaxID=66869 RepID=UPI0036497CD4
MAKRQVVSGARRLFEAASRRPDKGSHGLWPLCPAEFRLQDPHLDGNPVEALRNDGELAYLEGVPPGIGVEGGSGAVSLRAR